MIRLKSLCIHNIVMGKKNDRIPPVGKEVTRCIPFCQTQDIEESSQIMGDRKSNRPTENWTREKNRFLVKIKTSNGPKKTRIP